MALKDLINRISQSRVINSAKNFLDTDKQTAGFQFKPRQAIQNFARTPLPQSWQKPVENLYKFTNKLQDNTILGTPKRMGNSISYAVSNPKETFNILKDQAKNVPEFARQTVTAFAQPAWSKKFENYSNEKLALADSYTRKAIELSQSGKTKEAQKYFDLSRKTLDQARNITNDRIDYLNSNSVDYTGNFFKDAQSVLNTDIGRAGVGTANVAGMLFNPTGAAKTMAVGGLFKSGIDAVTGNDDPRSFVKGMDSASDYSGFVNITNPIISALSYKWGNIFKNPEVQKQVGKIIAGVGNVFEDRALSELYREKRTLVDDLMSFGVAYVMQNGGTKKDWDYLQDQFKIRGLGDKEAKIVLNGLKKVQSTYNQIDDTIKKDFGQHRLTFQNGKSIIVSGDLYANWTRYLDSQGIKYTDSYLGTQGGFADFSKGSELPEQDFKLPSKVTEGVDKYGNPYLEAKVDMPELSGVEKQINDLYVKAEKMYQPRNKSYNPEEATKLINKAIDLAEKNGYEIKYDGASFDGVEKIQPQPPKQDIDLTKEARKYKSAEEFVKSKINSYHGTPHQFDDFKVGAEKYSENRNAGIGIWFTNKKDVANQFTYDSIYINNDKTKNGRIIEAYHGLKNPKVFETPKNIKAIDDKIQSINEQINKVNNDRKIYKDGFNSGKHKYDWKTDRGFITKIEELEAKRTELANSKKDSYDIFQYEADKFSNKQEFVDNLKKQGYDGIVIKNTIADTKGGTNDQIVVFDPEQIKTKSQLTDIWNKANKSSLKAKVNTQPKIKTNQTKIQTEPVKLKTQLDEQSSLRALEVSQQEPSLPAKPLQPQSPEKIQLKTKQSVSSEPIRLRTKDQTLDNIIAQGRKNNADINQKTQLKIRQEEPVLKVKNQLDAKKQQQLAVEEAVKEAEAIVDKSLSDVGLKQPDNPSSSSKDIIPQTNKYTYNINKDKLKITAEEQKALDETISFIKPELEKVKGKTLTNKEVIESAKKSEILQQITTRDQTLKANAEMLKARQRLVELDKEITKLSKDGNSKELETKMREMIESLRVVSAEATDRGRKLQSLSITADDESVRQSLIKEISKVETDTDKILKEAKNVDWENAESVAKFYRKFIKPTTTEILDEFRYNNMLSNPRTHLRNAYSNLLQTFVTRPATLVAQGKFDEAVKYYGGAVKSIPDGVEAFKKSFSGKKEVEKPDFEYIPTQKIPKILTIPSRAMEAGDKFFSAIIKGGELAKGNTTKGAEDVAAYSLFRQDLKPKDQGKLLNGIDDLTTGVYSFGDKFPAFRWFVPFVKTPMNFVKQWIEFSPTGLATLPGAKNQKEQLAKTALGSIVTMIGAYLAGNGQTTWAAPTNKKEKDAFYASGRKPFSIKVGDKWVSMMYAGPFGFALALPAAYQYYTNESRTALTDSQLEKIGKTVSSMAEFLSGQTFLEGMGNFVSLIKGDVDYTLPKNMAYTAQQIIPLQGLVRYITTIIDPVYRKSSGTLEEVQKNIPFLSKELKPYTNPDGKPSTRETKNLITPYDITTSNPKYDDTLKQIQYVNQIRNIGNYNQKQVEAGAFDNIKQIPSISSTTSNSPSETMDTSIIDARISAKDPSLTGKEIATYYESRIDKPESQSAYAQAIYQDKVWDQVSNINQRDSLTDQQKDEASSALLEKIGVSKEDYQFYQVAKQKVDVKTLYVIEEAGKFKTTDEFFKFLVDGRKKVNNQQLVSSGVIDNLVDEGYLTYTQGLQLKKISFDKDGKVNFGRASKSGSTKAKALKLSVNTTRPKLNLAKVSTPDTRLYNNIKTSFNIPNVNADDIKIRVRQ